MPRIDLIKTEIAFHEKMFFGALAAILALIGWIVARYQDVNIWILVLAIPGLTGACAFGAYQYRRIKKLLLELERC